MPASLISKIIFLSSPSSSCPGPAFVYNNLLERRLKVKSVSLLKYIYLKGGKKAFSAHSLPAPCLSTVGNLRAACSGLVGQPGLSGADSSHHRRRIIKAGKQTGVRWETWRSGGKAITYSLAPCTIYTVADDQQYAISRGE